MKPGGFAALAAALVCVAGCPTRDKYDPAPTVRITSPTVEKTYTNRIVRVTAAIEPPLDLPISLFENGAWFATLEPPSYSYDWVTSGVPEGTHTLTAEVDFFDDVVRSAPVSVVVDRTPPTVSVTPEPGAQDVALRAPMRATFSEPIVLAQPPSATFSLSGPGGAPVPAHARVDADGLAASIEIDDLTGLQLPTSLVVTIGGGIADRAGNPLTPPSRDWAWNVPDFVRVPPVPLCSRLPAFTTLPALAVGSDLKPIVAWAATVSRADGLHCSLAVSRYENDALVALPSVSDDVNSALAGAALALAPDDEPFVAWRPGSLAEPGEIDVATLRGTVWQTTPAIAPGRGVSFPIVYPVLRVGPAATPALLWGAGSSADRYFMARLDEGGWREEFGTVPVTSQQPFDGPRFDMLLDGVGNPIVSWINPANRGHVAVWNGATWSPTPDVVNMTEPYLALDSTGAPMIVSGGDGSFFVQHLTDRNLWQPQPAIATPVQARHPRLAAGPDGAAVVAWFDGQTRSVGIGRWTAERWDVRAYAFSPPNAMDEAPRLVVDRYGTAWIGWRDAANFYLWMSNY